MVFHERKKNRLTDYDYSTPGAYFITTCVQDRRCVLGEIHNGQMFLNALGKIVHGQWEWLHRQYDYLILDAFVVMPNHFHAVLVISPDFLFVLVLLGFIIGYVTAKLEKKSKKETKEIENKDSNGENL